MLVVRFMDERGEVIRFRGTGISDWDYAVK
jgi:hypothetical protein